ncbi:MAG: 4-hydroxy-3-methylbut-2-enyl diphosphate reductase [Deltaproteobacteria bacterium]|nr:MAG: 4-hydroxy-3-methylbut-2-enyl diphosphate reductase [Deltaproteobacteria bacterium]
MKKKIVVARNAGFCFGVKRAIRLAFETAEKRGEEEIFTLGQIIHNPQVVEQLKEMGVRMVCDVDEVRCGTLIIRTHGITKGEMDALSERDLKIVDATCPFVKKAKEHALTLAREGYVLLIVGDREHPEVKSIISYVEDLTEVITEFDRIGSTKRKRKAGVIAQTTQSQETLEKWVKKALSHFQEVRVYNTICSATSVRQRETVDLARRSDAVVIIGGRNSANTRRLVELASRENGRVYHIERVEEVDSLDLSEAETIGVSAGASTPDWLIEEVIRKIRDSVEKGRGEVVVDTMR